MRSPRLGRAGRLVRSRGRVYPAVKRLLDVAVAGVGLVFATPVMGAIAIAVRRDLGSPVLFRQVRPGKDGKPFELIKFRTMRHQVASETDLARMTELGRWLRSTSLDELPTLWNVVRGDMSLVGPRPLLPAYQSRYTATQARRHEVRPGVTGLAQVRGRNALSWEDKFASDIEYVDGLSFRRDLRILLTTVGAVLTRRGISASDLETMPEFMGTASAPPMGDAVAEALPSGNGLPVSPSGLGTGSPDSQDDACDLSRSRSAPGARREKGSSPRLRTVDGARVPIRHGASLWLRRADSRQVSGR